MASRGASQFDFECDSDGAVNENFDEASTPTLRRRRRHTHGEGRRIRKAREGKTA